MSGRGEVRRDGGKAREGRGKEGRGLGDVWVSHQRMYPMQVRRFSVAASLSGLMRSTLS